MTKKSAETFIPEEILNVLQALKAKHNWVDVSPYNKWLRENRPTIPKSTVTRWTRSFTTGAAHSETPTWHKHYREEKSLVPSRFSALKNGAIQAARAQWERDGQIRYVNMSDFHRPLGDGAILTLGMRIVRDFKPNAFPCFTDWFDMDRFNQHPPKPGSAGVEFSDDPENEEIVIERKNKFSELEAMSLETINMVKAAVPVDCVLLNLWGNHEQWLLRSMLGEQIDSEFGEYYIDKYFQLLYDNDILWCEGEKNHWLPLTKLFWVGHGHRSRSGFGKTAQGYLNLLRATASVAVGHTHRQEVVYVPVPYDGQRFAAVAGTMGQVQPVYTNREFTGHSWGFQLIEHPFHHSKGNHVEDVRINYQDGYYVTRVFGKEYSEQATFTYDEYMDFI
jgi:hypothetical protein